MTSRAGRILWLLTGIISLIFAVLSLYLVGSLASTRDAMLQTYRTGTWAAVQVEQEYDRLLTASYVLEYEQSDSARDEFRLRFDLFWSRINVVLSGQETSGVRELHNVVPAYTRLRGLLSDLDQAYQIETGPLDNPKLVAEAVRTTLAKGEDAIRDTVRIILMQDSVVYNRDKIEEQVHRTVIVLGVVLVLGLILIAVALSQTRRANRLVQQTRLAYQDVERLRRATESSADGIGLTDADGLFTSANRALSDMLVIPASATVVGRPWNNAFDPALRQQINDELNGQIAATGRWRGLVTLKREQAADLPIELELRRLDDGGLLFLARDMTKQVADAAARRELEKQLLVAQKMEAIARLASGFAHDFNNVLASIQGYGELLEEDLPEGDERRDFARRILAGTRRGRDLVERILAFARPRQDTTGSCHLQDVLDELQGLMRGALPKAIVLKITAPPEPIMIDCSSVQLLQVVMNLAVNARDAIGDQPGLITIEAGAQAWQQHAIDAGDGPSVTIGQCAPGHSYVRLAVRDNGSGITHEDMLRIFEPFFTTKPDGKGTGLGLAAVHNIVIGLGGQIMVRSQPGEGTEFIVFMPITASLTPAQPAAGPTTPAPAVAGRLRVLLVEDEDMLRHITRTALERAGMMVVGCANADEAWQQVTEGSNSFDVMVTDEMMHGQTGRELIASLRAAGHRLPILLWSGNIEEADLDRGPATPARDHFTFRRKPLPINDLISLVKSLAAEVRQSDSTAA